MKQQTLRKIGNSVGIIIPNEVLNNQNLEIGKKVYIKEEGNRIVISKEPTYSTVTPEVMKIAEDIIEEYKADFKELADK